MDENDLPARRPAGAEKGKETQVERGCLECKSLERMYERTIRRIYAVVDGRFANVNEKLRELRKCQNLRDEALELLYVHKKAHRRERGRRDVRAA
jgi:hypothetical protein